MLGVITALNRWHKDITNNLTVSLSPTEMFNYYYSRYKVILLKNFLDTHFCNTVICKEAVFVLLGEELEYEKIANLSKILNSHLSEILQDKYPLCKLKELLEVKLPKPELPDKSHEKIFFIFSTVSLESIEEEGCRLGVLEKGYEDVEGRLFIEQIINQSNRLSPREKEVCRLLGEGYRPSELIAMGYVRNKDDWKRIKKKLAQEISFVLHDRL